MTSIICPKCAHLRQAQETAPAWQCPQCSIAYAKFQATQTEPAPKRRVYIPNSIPAATRWGNTAAALFLLAYGSYGVWVNDLYLPGKRGPGVHLHDESALLVFAAMLCGCAVLLAVVIDHYDERDNEHRYRQFGKIIGTLGWALFIGALIYFIASK